MAVTRAQLESLTPATARAEWAAIVRRPTPVSGGPRGPHFTAVEEILSYAALFVVAPNSQGGSDWTQYHPVLQQIGAALRRSPGSIANKGGNLTGSRAHGQSHEQEIYAALGAGELPFPELYCIALEAAREVGVSEHSLPDFLELLHAGDGWGSLFIGDDELVGEDIEAAATQLLTESPERTVAQAMADIRIGQSRFARGVLIEFDHRCAFCGLDGRALAGHRLTVASHIKPWRHSDARERLDPRNGLAACPTHDAAFDTGLLTIDDCGGVHRAGKLQRAVEADPAAAGAFTIREQLIARQGWQRRRLRYLSWHREHVWVNHEHPPSVTSDDKRL